MAPSKTGRLSVVIITRDEERDLGGCLESLKGLGAEVVVLDNSSTDRTREVARSFGARVHERPFDDFASQKQAAVDLSTGEWVLSIDADERLSPELSEEILSRLQSDPPGIRGFDIPFEVRFMGRRLRFGGLGGETHLRLFRRDSGRFVGGRLHEGIELDGPRDRLKGRIVHVPYRDLDEYLAKLGIYTTNAALKRFEEGRRFTPLHHLLPFWEFFRRTVLRLGLLDGTPGVVWAGLSAFHTWVKYLKLKELQDR